MGKTVYKAWESNLLIEIMFVTCRIYRGELKTNVTLNELVPYATTFYAKRPRMIRFRQEGVSHQIFNNFKFRLMGGGDKHRHVLYTFLERLPFNVDVVGDLQLSTMTVTHRYTHQQGFNLLRLLRSHFRVELGLFPTAKWLHPYGRENVNLFYTGSLVITGVKSEVRAWFLIHHSEACINNVNIPRGKGKIES
jgi:hypothetical protein